VKGHIKHQHTVQAEDTVEDPGQGQGPDHLNVAKDEAEGHHHVPVADLRKDRIESHGTQGHGKVGIRNLKSLALDLPNGNQDPNQRT